MSILGGCRPFCPSFHSVGFILGSSKIVVMPLFLNRRLLCTCGLLAGQAEKEGGGRDGSKASLQDSKSSF